jgi:hypothetical protein
MRFIIWSLGAALMIVAASCSLLNPTANQATVQASNQYGNSCVIAVNLDGNNPVTISNGTWYTFPLVSPGSHTLNFWTSNPSSVCTSGANCVFSNNNSVTFSTTFNASSGDVYVGTVKQGTNCYDLVESGP